MSVILFYSNPHASGLYGLLAFLSFLSAIRWRGSLALRCSPGAGGEVNCFNCRNCSVMHFCKKTHYFKAFLQETIHSIRSTRGRSTRDPKQKVKNRGFVPICFFSQSSHAFRAGELSQTRLLDWEQKRWKVRSGPDPHGTPIRTSSS